MISDEANLQKTVKKRTKPENSGRQKGAANLRTREIANRAIQEGISPLEIMIRAARWHYEQAEAVEIPDELLADKDAVKEAKRERSGLYSVAVESAKSAAPYMHPRLQQMTLTGAEGGPVRTESTLSVAGLSDAQLAAIAAIPVK